MLEPLSREELRWVCDPAGLDFESTAKVEPVNSVLGQEDAVDALRFGLGQSAVDLSTLTIDQTFTGTIGLNGGQWFDSDTPFGGYKQSGLGRENGQQGFEEHLETKVMAIPDRR